MPLSGIYLYFHVLVKYEVHVKGMQDKEFDISTDLLCITYIPPKCEKEKLTPLLSELGVILNLGNIPRSAKPLQYVCEAE